MRVYFISSFNLFAFAGIEIDGRSWIEVGLQELGSKFRYRSRDRNWVTGIGIEVGLQELRSKLVTGIGIEAGIQELASKLMTGIETGS